MGIQEVQGQKGTPAYPKKKNAGCAEGFQESLLQNLKYRDREQQTAADIQTGAKRIKAAVQTKQGISAGQTGEKQNTADVQTGVREKAGVGRIGMAPGIRVNAAAAQEALQAVEVRHMSYEDSDHVRIAVTEGYTLKGKLLRDTDMAGQKSKNTVSGSEVKDSEEAEAAQVYVEAKYDDGRLEAYQVDTAKISAGTEHVIEKFALETLEEA